MLNLIKPSAMLKQTLFPLVLATLVFAGCTTAYKTGQTPDDVYYSPARPQDEYVRMDQEEDNRYNYYSDDFYDDRFLRMRMRNRTRWSELDDWYWNERRFRYNVFVGNGMFGYDPWSPFNTWNNWYNPYFHPYFFTPVVVSQPRLVYSRPRTFNLNTFTPSGGGTTAGTINTNPKLNTGSTRPSNSGYNNGRTTSGSVLRNIFGGSGSSSSGSSGSSGSGARPSSGSSGSSSGSTAPVRRF